MKKSKKFIIMSVVFVLIIVVAVGIYLFYKSIPYNTITTVLYMYDTSIPEQAVGISDYVFVAKVNGIARTDYIDTGTVELKLTGNQKKLSPYTVYNVDVVKNIKGELITSEPIEYMQYGGINEDGKGYTYIPETDFLEVGKYYLLLVNTFRADGGILETSDKNRIILLDDVESDEEVENSELVKKYEEAYKNEYIPEGAENETRYISKYDVNYEDAMVE